MKIERPPVSRYLELGVTWVDLSSRIEEESLGKSRCHDEVVFLFARPSALNHVPLIRILRILRGVQLPLARWRQPIQDVQSTLVDWLIDHSPVDSDGTTICKC